MIKIIEGEVFVFGAQYLDSRILIINPKKEDISLANELSSFNGKKVKITVEVLKG